MATKTTGAEFKRFYADPAYWPPEAQSHKDNVWHEDETVTVDGELTPEDFDLGSIPDAAVVVIEGGVVHGPDWDKDDGPSFETYFKRWRKAQSTATFLVECDLKVLEAVKSAVKAAGGRVV